MNEEPTTNRLVDGRPRLRLGVIVPSVNTVVEPWYAATVPAGIAVFAARMRLDNHLTPEAVHRMDEEEGQRAVDQIGSCRPAAVAYCCTASSVVQGIEYDSQLQRTLGERLGVPCITAMSAIVTALIQLRAKKIAVASPYPDTIDEMESSYLRERGFEVVRSVNLGIQDAFDLAKPSAQRLYDLGHEAWDVRADALLIPCLNTHSHAVIDALEHDLGKPVVTSTQATLWKLLRTAGVSDAIPGYGQLLQQRTESHP